MSKLDEYQMKVVNETGHCLVIAGPGSGKSTTICEKVKTLIANGTNESEILLISFTNKSVDDLKKKLGSDIFITTFHRLAIDILKYNKINYQICSDTLLDYIIEEYLMTIKDKAKLCRYLNITKLDKGKNEYISLKKLIKTFINLFKTNNHNINSLNNIVKDYQDKYLLKIILDIFYLYEEEKNSTGSLDFDDLIIIATKILNIKYNFIDVAITLLGFIYAGIFFSFITLINQKPGGEFLVWLPLIASWGCDILAYYSGKHLGKHKLCPRVSPKKTVEGSIGGILGSTIVCGIYGIIIYQFFPEFSMLNYFIIGALCGVFCQFGDLVASSVKRYVGVKDYSNLIPGHGGILDRFDSVLFASVVVFVYLTIATIIIHL